MLNEVNYFTLNSTIFFMFAKP